MSIHRVGVISDTHGLLRPAAAAALHGVELIIHAGDIGQRRVLEGLEEIAPVVAVRGNVDRVMVKLDDIKKGAAGAAPPVAAKPNPHKK